MPVLFFEIILPLVFVFLIVGAAVLWTKTRRVAAVMQLAACSVIFGLLAVENVANRLMRAEKPQLFDLIHRSDMERGGQILFIVSFLAFPVSYLWYALTHKRI